MKNRLVLVLALFVFPACGAPEPSTETDAVPKSESTSAETASAKVADSDGGPCSALDATPVRYDAAGKPVAYTFEYPGGWEVKELFTSGATSIDITKSTDDNSWPEFVLRFGHVVDKRMDNPQNLVETWKKLPMTEDIFEVDIEGRTMHVSRNKIGTVTGYQAVFPDVTSDSKAWLVSGGVSEVPKGCRDKANEAVERIFRSFAPNPDIGPPPPAS